MHVSILDRPAFQFKILSMEKDTMRNHMKKDF